MRVGQGIRAVRKLAELSVFFRFFVVFAANSVSECVFCELRALNEEYLWRARYRSKIIREKVKRNI